MTNVDSWFIMIEWSFILFMVGFGRLICIYYVECSFLNVKLMAFLVLYFNRLTTTLARHRKKILGLKSKTLLIIMKNLFNFCPLFQTICFVLYFFLLVVKGRVVCIFLFEKAFKIPIVSLTWMLSTNAQIVYTRTAHR